MSVDNGVYILKTKDKQIRVVHSQGINRLFDYAGRYIPEQINRHFGIIKYTKSINTAIRIAENIRKKLPVCEYGVQVIPYCDKTWKQIMDESVKENYE